MATYRRTQTLIFFIFLLCLTTVVTHAADATFSWTANSEAVSGYKIHYGTTSHSYTFVVDVGLPEAVNGSIVATVQGLLEGTTYYFAATAYSATEESDYSIEVIYAVAGSTTTPPQQPPTVDNTSLQGGEDTPLSGQLIANSSAGTTLTFTVVSQPAHGTITIDDNTGSFTYTPALNYSGDDTFSYTVGNSAGTSNPATVTIHLNSANDAPTANNTAFSVNEDSIYSGTLSATDIDGDTLAYSLVAQAQKGTVTIAPNGSFTYTPGHDLFGSDSFTFKVSDGSSTSNTATVNITVNPVNDPPIADSTNVSINENTTYSGQLSATDAEGGSLTYSLVAQAGKGTVSINPTGSFSYIPQHNLSGTDSFTFKVSDGSSISNTATINVTINPVADPPVATPTADATFSWTANSEAVSGYKIHYGTSSHNYTFVVDVGLPEAVNGSIVATVQGLLEGTTYYFAATAYSATEESDYSVEVIYAVAGSTTTPPQQPPTVDNTSLQGGEDTPLSGQLIANSSAGTALTFTVVSQPNHGTITIDDNTGSFTYTPALDYSGDDTFSYTVGNTAGTSNPATVNVTINPVNDPPVADSTSFSINENTAYTGQLSASDTEGASLTYSLVAQAGKGTVSITPGGAFSYLPQHNLSGTDSFTFKVSDGSIASNTAQVNITIQHVNIAPVTQNSSFSVDQGTPYSGQLIATDENGDVLHFSIATTPEKGTLLLADNGSFTYTPNADASGADLFTFQATDGTASSNRGTVNILINEVTNDLAFELGELLVTSDWQHVDFSNEYTSPSVIAKSNTMNDSDAGIVSIRNLTNSGFDIRIRNWDYIDGFHPEETVSFMAMERGRHQIADNVYAVAECTNLSGLNTFQQIKFANSFSSQPVVLSSIVTENESSAAILRMKAITPQKFSITMQEQENNDGNHTKETVCYIAMEQWSGVVDGLMIEAGSTQKILTDKASTISFKQQFPTIPFVLADMQSANGLDTATVGMNNLSVTNTRMTILEEQSADRETRHITETGGYIAITPYKP